jgi:ribosomal protein L29
MKTKEKKELLEKSVPEIKKLITEARTKIFTHKMDKEQGKLTDLRIIGKIRDDIARMLTVVQIKMKEGGKNA